MLRGLVLPLSLAPLALGACLAASGCTGAKDSQGGRSFDAGSEASAYHGELCCQITVDTTDDPNWHNCRFPCPYTLPDAGSVPLTDLPWVCNLSQVVSCDDPSCVPGSTCQGVNGTGVVLPCERGLSPEGVGVPQSLCPTIEPASLAPGH
jgi:hypothetical protein